MVNHLPHTAPALQAAPQNTHINERPNMGLGGITPKQKLAIVAWDLLLNPVINGGITMHIAIFILSSSRLNLLNHDYNSNADD